MHACDIRPIGLRICPWGSNEFLPFSLSQETKTLIHAQKKMVNAL